MAPLRIRRKDCWFIAVNGNEAVPPDYRYAVIFAGVYPERFKNAALLADKLVHEDSWNIIDSRIYSARNTPNLVLVFGKEPRAQGISEKINLENAVGEMQLNTCFNVPCKREQEQLQYLNYIKSYFDNPQNQSNVLYVRGLGGAMWDTTNLALKVTNTYSHLHIAGVKTYVLFDEEYPPTPGIAIALTDLAACRQISDVFIERSG